MDLIENLLLVRWDQIILYLKQDVGSGFHDLVFDLV